MDLELKNKYLITPKSVKYGSLGELNVIKDKFSNILSAVKIIKNIGSKSDVIIRLKKEIECLKQLAKYDAFAKLKEAFLENEHQYLVYDYNENILVEHVTSNYPLIKKSPESFFGLINQLIMAITVLNENKIYVENLNWNNFLGISTPKGINLKLVDFGLSYLIEEGNLGLLYGVPITFTPEFFLDKSITNLEHYYSWVIGIMIFQLLFLSHPFGSNLNQVLTNYSKIVEGKLLVIDCINKVLVRSTNFFDSNDTIDKLIILVAQLLCINPSSRMAIVDVKYKLSEIFKLNEPEKEEKLEIKSVHDVSTEIKIETDNSNLKIDSNKSVINTTSPIIEQSSSIQKTEKKLIPIISTEPIENSSVILKSNNIIGPSTIIPINNASSFNLGLKSSTIQATGLNLNLSKSLNPLIAQLENNKSSIKSKFELSSLLLGPSEHNLSYPYNYFIKNNKLNHESIKNIATDSSRAFNLLKEFDLHFETAKISESEENIGYYLKAIVLMGRCLEKGIGTSVNVKEAISCYRKVIKSDFIPAKINIARCYLAGLIGGKKNVDTAEEMINQIKSSASFEENVMLAYIYLGRDNVPINTKLATDYYNKAYSLGGHHPIIDNLEAEISNVRNIKFK